MKTCSNSLHRYIVTSFSRLNTAKVCVIFVVCIAAVSGAFAQKRNITEKDLWDFVWIGDPQVSPDGSRVAFVRVTVNDKKEGYNTSIWTVAPATGEIRQFTNGTRDS